MLVYCQKKSVIGFSRNTCCATDASVDQRGALKFFSTFLVFSLHLFRFLARTFGLPHWFFPHCGVSKLERNGGSSTQQIGS